MDTPEWVTMRHPTGRVEQRHAVTVDYWTRHGWQLDTEPAEQPDPETPAAAAEDDTTNPPRQARQTKGKPDGRADI